MVTSPILILGMWLSCEGYIGWRVYFLKVILISYLIAHYTVHETITVFYVQAPTYLVFINTLFDLIYPRDK